MTADPPDPENEDEAPENLTGTVVRGAGFAAVGFALAQSLTFCAYLILARLATPAEFGEFAAAALIVNIGLLFTESGMLSAVVQRRDRIDEAASTATVATALAGLLFALMALAASPLIGRIFKDPDIGYLAAGMSGLLFLRSLQVVPEALLQRRFSFLRRMVVQPAQVIAFGVTAIILVSKGMGAWGLAIGYYASALTDVILSWSLVRWRPRRHQISFAMWKELAAYGRHLVTSNIALRVYEEVPTVIIGRFTGAAALGQYSYAQRISSTPFGLLLATAAYVIFPALSRIADDRKRFAPAVLRSLRSVAVLSCLMGFLLVSFGISSVVILFGDEWREAGKAIIPLGCAVAITSITAIATEAFAAYGRPEIILPSHLVTGVTGTVAMLALAGFGLVGVASGIAIGAAAGCAYELVRLHGMLDIPYREYARRLLPPATSALLMTAIMLPVDRLVLNPSAHGTVLGLILLLGELGAAIAIYAGILYRLSPDAFHEATQALSRARRGRGTEAPAA